MAIIWMFQIFISIFAFYLKHFIMKKPSHPIKVLFLCYTRSSKEVVIVKVFKTYRAWSTFEDKLYDRYVEVHSSIIF